MSTGMTVGGGCVELPKITEAAWAADGSTYYEKYSNGTLKQWGTAKIDSSGGGAVTVTFPVEFIDSDYFLPAVTGRRINSAYVVFATSYENKTKNNVIIYVRKPTDQSAVQPLYFDWLAVGRWK